MKDMAQELGVNKKSARKAVNLPGAHSLARTKGFLVTESLKASWLVRAKKILGLMKKNSPVILFPNSSISPFTQCPI
jgi:hypothetical protein